MDPPNRRRSSNSETTDPDQYQKSMAAGVDIQDRSSYSSFGKTKRDRKAREGTNCPRAVRRTTAAPSPSSRCNWKLEEGRSCVSSVRPHGQDFRGEHCSCFRQVETDGSNSPQGPGASAPGPSDFLQPGRPNTQVGCHASVPGAFSRLSIAFCKSELRLRASANSSSRSTMRQAASRAIPSSSRSRTRDAILS